MLSFIIPVYKKAHIIERCIKSLLDQSLKEWEAIFVLDGPQPEEEAIIHSMMKKKPNNYKVVEIEHGGACRARNEGFSHSKGEHVVFWDADCIIEPEASKAWVDIFNRQPEIGFIYSGYKFLHEQGAIDSEPFDPWLLRVRNYISTMSPLRRELFQPWKEELKSLQDWDFFLTLVDRGAKAKFMRGYSFSTELGGKETISGQGCTEDVWLERVDAVKKLHGLPERDLCVTSLRYKPDGIHLAKFLDADYQDYPNFKPHRYTSIIQVGFSLHPNLVEAHANAFSNPKTKNVLFWTGDNITEIYNQISFNAISKYRILLNSCSTQFVEDKEAERLMTEAGFKVSIMPVPFHNLDELKPLPETPKFAVDISRDYGQLFEILDGSLPDVKLEFLTGQQKMEDFTGLIHFYSDKTMSSSIKRCLLAGRHVISNVKSPFAGFVDDASNPEKIIGDIVDKVRSLKDKPLNKTAHEFWNKFLGKEKLLELCK